MQYLPIIGLCLELICLFFIVRLNLKEIFTTLRKFIKSERTIFVLISLLFFLGTTLHEIAHFLAATILMLRVREIRVFPKLEENYIKLGEVIYEKKDIVRSIFVGIAPILGGLFIFWALASFKLFPSNNLLQNILLGYLIFAISSTMFSSKKDLIDLIYIVPLSIILMGIFYVFNIRLDFLLAKSGFLDNFLGSIRSIDSFMLFSLLINIIIMMTLKFFNFLLQR